MKTKHLVFLIALFFATVAFVFAENPLIESYVATVAGMHGARNQPYQIKIEIAGYTSEEDAAKLADVLKSGGQDALVKALASYKLGTIAPFGRQGSDLNYVRVFNTDKGKVIRMISNREMDFFEYKYNGRSVDFPFSIVELLIKNDGKMEGWIIIAAKIGINKDHGLDVESLGMEKTYLVSIQKKK